MKIVFGLGNPGLKYKKTRHNAGFMVADQLAAHCHFRFKNAAKLEAKIAQTVLDGEKCLFVKPQTYMNHSGYAVSAVMDYFNADLRDIVVVYDDVDLPFGGIRIRQKGSAGTHNGMRSIIQYLKSGEFTRVRVGIGRPHGQKDLVAHVIGKFEKTERADFEQTVERAAQAVLCVLKDGAALAQSRYNEAGKSS